MYIQKTAKEKYNTKTITGVFTNELLSGKRYDLITLSHVAEHLNNAQFIFSEIHKSLNENGLLFIEVPDMDLFDETNESMNERTGVNSKVTSPFLMGDQYNLKNSMML